MYSFSFLFFTLPLYFSHIFLPFGLVIWEAYSFERQKVIFFFGILLLSYLEWIIRFPQLIENVYKKYLYIIIILLILPIVSMLYFGWRVDTDFLIWSYEKHHWYIFYFSIINFIFLLAASTSTQLKKYLSWSIFSSVLVAWIAIGEHIGWILDIYGRSEMYSLYDGRSSSTLGNPNYVAGYLLLFIPIVIGKIEILKERYWKQSGIFILYLAILWFLVGWIYSTGSHIALFLIWFLCLWYCLRYLFVWMHLWKQVALLLSFTGVITFLLYSSVEPSKFLSLESRFVLMKETFGIMIQYPISFFIGFGPDSILSYFSHMRSSLVNLYFPRDMLIDSFHNIFLDIFFQYWIIPFVLFFSMLYKERRNILSPFGLAILLILFFLSLNVFVISHIILISLLVAYVSQVPSGRK